MSETIIVGTDGSETAGLALDEAIRLAQAFDGEVHIVSAYKALRGTSVHGSPVRAQDAIVPLSDTLVDGILEKAETKARASGVKLQTHAVASDPVDALLNTAAEVGATMIIVGSRGMHGARRLLGSVPDKISHQASCNVLIVSTDRPK